MSMNLTQQQGSLTGQLQLVDDHAVVTNFTVTGTVTQTVYTRVTYPETTKKPVDVSFTAVSTNKGITLTFTGRYDVTSGEMKGTFIFSQGDHGTWDVSVYCNGDCGGD
jgi:hypothetical protein